MKRGDIGRNLLITYFVWAVAPAAAIPLPLVCKLTSEESPSIKIRLTERTTGSLKGELIQNGSTLGDFQSGKPKRGKDPWWSFQKDNNSSKGVSVFFKGTEIWNPYRRIPRPQDSNRVFFAGLAAALWNWDSTEQRSIFRGNIDLLKSAGGIWSISSQCVGGRIVDG
ncbi:hypothetical protein MITS9509_02565 [Synechococcus sp. MIT S9509]|nr:hypothetical protein MITS9504_02334 [Synechococcus sp. MIT S9504]KZR91336.1 hypothetical protein MITS9509_02565 [Synechococcus sp. MIT S9509]